MRLSDRDRRALVILLSVVSILGVHRLITTLAPIRDSGVATTSASVERLQKILSNQRRAAASVARKEQMLRQMKAELGTRERNLIQAETAAQAQARLLEIIKQVAQRQVPPLEILQIEFSPPRRFNEAYGEVLVSVTLQCTIDEVLNLVAELTCEAYIIATDEIALTVADQSHKTLQAHITVTGLVYRRLVDMTAPPHL